MTSPPGELEHSGVKGMKWGVRKDNRHEGERTTNKKISKLDKKFEKQVANPSTYTRLHNHAAVMTNEHDVARINDKPQYKNADFTHDSPLRQKYYAEHQAAFVKHLRDGAAIFGTNASGTRKVSITVNKDGDWNVTTSEVKHDDGSDNFVVKPVYDSTGHIIRLTVPDSEMAHSGVKGMKWGVHKVTGAALDAHPEYTKSRQSRDRQNFSRAGMRRVNQDLHSGSTYKEAQTVEFGRRRTNQNNARIALAGGVVAARILAKHGPQLASTAKIVGEVLGHVITVRAEANRTYAHNANTRGISSTPHVAPTPRTVKPNRQGVHKIHSI